MRRFALFALAPLAATATLPCPARAQSSDIAERVDRFTAPLLENGDLSGAILIGTPDSILFLTMYGMADYERSNPNTLDTRFLTASVTKTFTAAAIALLQEEGALSFQDSLSRFIPDFPRGDDITIEHLLAHMSGADNPDYLNSFDNRITLEGLLARIAAKPLLFDPGSNNRYSNAGYNILANVIERVSGITYEGFLRERFFDPLGMTRSGHFDLAETAEYQAKGYIPGPSGPQPVPWYDITFSTGSGSLWSTVGDLYRWGIAIHQDSFYDLRAQWWPFGWGKVDIEGHAGVWQTGATTGFMSSLTVFDEGVIVVLLMNQEAGPWVPWTRTLGRIAWGLPFETSEWRETVTLDAGTLDAYTGTYESGDGNVHVRNEADHLWLHFGDWPLGKYIAPLSLTEFTPLSDMGTITFGMERNGLFQEMTWGDRSYSRVRSEE